ncbi:FRG1-like family-domain-containing protein [Lipomyces chichibuensis]|uniref:FRG1-like family-domain-containing protein n=1 Tax=Lipomyces chichibuensis TaxID=1546026 RepID=UPI003343B3FF
MVSKLTFKNDKPKKRKRDKAGEEEDQDDGYKSRKTSSSETQKAQQDHGQNEDNEEGWVNAKTKDDLNGPCMFILNDSPPLCMSSDGSGKVFPTVIKSYDPSNVQQVFVLGNIVQSEKYTVKSYLGKYFTVSKYGICEATSEAIGPEQELAIERKETGDGWVITSAWDKYFCLSHNDVRCDSESAGFKETLMIRVQAKFRKRPSKTIDESQRKIHTRELEEKVGAPLDYETIKILKQAFRNGRLNEAILDVKEKMKTDHRC